MNRGGAPPRSALRLHVLALLAWGGAMFAVFAAGFARSEHGFFHRFFDQVSYRHDAAHVAEALVEHGWLAGLSTSWEKASAQGFAYPLVGDTVNTGSRLEGLAPAGGILVGAETYGRLPAGAVVERRPGLRMKAPSPPGSPLAMPGAG